MSLRLIWESGYPMGNDDFLAGYRRFCKQVDRYLSNAGIPSTRVVFRKSREKLQYFAEIKSENLTIYGRPSGLSMTVKFGSGHQAMVRA